MMQRYTNTFKITFIYLPVFMLIFFTACKKDKQAISLQGNWVQSEPKGEKRYADFIGDSVRIQLVTREGQPVKVVTTNLKGKFYTKEDSLKINIDRVIRIENNVVVTNTAFTGAAFDKATYKIKGNNLTINYITYPADAPVASTAVFTREVVGEYGK